MNDPDAVELVRDNLKHAKPGWLRLAMSLVGALTRNGRNRFADKWVVRAGTGFKSVVSALCRNRRFQVGAGVAAKDYLTVGCGRNIQDEFINLDYHWRPGIDLCWDVTKGLPLKDESLKGVFTEHCLEHLAFESIGFVLNEFRRVLKPGGTVRIIVPDGGLYLSRYAETVGGKPGTGIPYAEGDCREGVYSPILSVNRLFRESGHQCIYDFHLLELLLKKEGFVKIRRESFRAGRDAQLLIDSESRRAESLYVEASKLP